MLKKVCFAVVLLALAAVTAFAAPLSGKVASIDKQEVRVTVSGKLADWVKKGVGVKFLGVRGTIVKVGTDGVTISSPKAATAKVGDTVTFDKAKATAAGC